MNYDVIHNIYKNDPSIIALRKASLPLAIGYLHYMFKQKHEIQIPRDVFAERLTLYIEHINNTLPEVDQYPHTSEYYVERWSREDDLIRIRNHDDGYIVILSPHAERLLGWFEDMQNHRMIGTESQLRTILTLLDEVVTQSTEDVEARLKQLYQRREEIETEINRINET